MDINGKTVIEQIAHRLSFCTLLDQVVIATADTPANRVIVNMAEEKHIPCYAGSENDLVDRMYQTAKTFGATALVRITADCPLVDPKQVDAIVQAHLEDPQLDYVTNVLPPTYPDGLDVDLITISALERLWQRSRHDAFMSEWALHDVRTNPILYPTKNLSQPQDMSQLRWTVDYPEDMDFVSKIFNRLSPGGEIFYFEDVLQLLAREPALSEINEKYVRDAAYYAALEAQKNSKTSTS